MSLNVGQTESFKIKTAASSYRIEIYRLGYYQGNGARKIADVTPSATLPQSQPACATDPDTEIYDCGTWGVSASWIVPSTAVSGVYIARLIRTDGGGDGDSPGEGSHVPFVVRNDASTSTTVFQTSDSTWQAYNSYGGADFYQGQINGRAYKISYNRPFANRGGIEARDYLFSNEFPMIRFLEANGYDLSYISSLDTDVRGNLLTNHKTFLSVGHDEYWSANQRSNVVAARDAGVNLAFFSGNEVYWKTRWEPSQDGSSTANRTLVCYKDTWAGQQIDPVASTATWRDPRFGSNGQGPENGLTGTIFKANSVDLAVTVSQAEGKTRLWRNTTLATTGASTTVLAAHTVGYESDEDIDNGYRPAGLIRLSTTTGSTPQYLTDYGSAVVPGTTTHHVTMYKAASGARVFGAGTIQWAWGVDANHDGTATPVDVRMQQATINILADMSAPATSVMSGLVATTKTADVTAPTAAINSPANNTTLAQGSQVTVSGTATENAGGGVVAGVEVSVDGGSTWHPATGTTGWSYTGILTGSGATAIQARAIDDSGNIQSTPAARNITSPCPCSIFGQVVPATPAANDSGAVTLGTRFTTSANGFVTGIRFYKGTGNTGSHIGSLYTDSGTLLATGTFSNETASGWQTLTFPAAVGISTGTTYVAAYYAPAGHYAADPEYFAYRGATAGTLTALGSYSNPNGVYTGSTNAVPDQSYSQTNYYVDALYTATDTSPLTIVSSNPPSGASSVGTGATVSAVLSKDSTSTLSLTGPGTTAVAGTSAYTAATKTVTFTPGAPLANNVVYTAKVTAGTTTVSTWTFTTAAANGTPGVCPCRLYEDSESPATAPDADGASVELGTAFSSDVNGTITGVRFYKGAGNTGTHTVSLRNSSGTVLATATVGSESTVGWQQATFGSPVAITAGTVYIVSYRAPSGHYSADAGALSAERVRAPLRTPANAGRYGYGTSLPTNGSSATYYVTPIMTVPAGSAPVVTAIDPTNQSTSVQVSSPVIVTFDQVVQPATAVITVSAGGSNVPGTVAAGNTNKKVVFTPSAAMVAATAYTVTISGTKNQSGVAMTAPASSTFTTAGSCPCSVFASNAQPAVSDSGDGSAVTVGLRFAPSAAGTITALRYYRDAANTGTHTGSLYSSSGTKLAGVTFTNGAAGWQTATLATPVAVTAGTTYVVAVYDPVGRYSVTSGFFVNQYVNSPLTGQLGVYAYGSDTFPVNTYGGSNYFVDVLFSRQAAAAPVVVSKSPSGSPAQLNSAVTATFDQAVTSSSVVFTLTGPGGATVPGTVSYNASSFTATFQPSAALTYGTSYTAAVSATSSAGIAMTSPTSWTFSTVAAPPTGTAYSLYADTDLPDTPAWNDPGPVTLGIKFSSTVAGTVTAVKFYAGPGNTGPQPVALYSNTGTKLGGGTATGTVSGWTTVLLDSPVAITSGSTYTAAYTAPNGRYAVTVGGLSSGRSNGPLTIPASGAVYTYASGMPSSTSSASYFVDVVVVTP